MAHNGPSNDYDAKEPRYTNQWSLRNVRWRTVLGRQDYANILCSLLLVVALAVVHWVATPRQVELLLGWWDTWDLLTKKSRGSGAWQAGCLSPARLTRLRFKTESALVGGLGR